MTTPQRPPQGHPSGVEIVEFSVAIVAGFVDALSINPDNLRKAQLVPPDAGVLPAMIVSPGISFVRFDTGLTFKAEPEKLTVEQSGRNLDPDKLDCARIAKGLVERFPVRDCRAMGINPKGLVAARDPSGESILNMFAPGLEWVSLDGTTPEIKLSAVYRSQDKTITLGIEPASPAGAGTIFHGNIHRDIEGPTDEERKVQVLSFLDSSRQDLEKFLALTEKFDFRRKTP